MTALRIAWSNSVVRRAVVGACVCALCTALLIVCVSITRSLVLTSAAWMSVFSFFSLVSTIISQSVSHKPTTNYTFGLARAPVLAVFSTTVLASLSSIFLAKESVEHLLESDHHLHSHGLYLFGAAAASLSLELAAYGVKNQPFQHVLTASSSSSLQEHFADVSHAVCYVLPGLSVFLLPRLNAMSLLAFLTTCACFVTHWFVSELWYIDATAALILSMCVFITMWPLSKYTGRILLQTSPPHVHNQIDRCMSEASTIEGVLELRNAHFWQLDFGSMVGTVDVRVRRDADEQLVLALVTEKLSSVVSFLTVQVVKDVSTSWQAYDPQFGGIPGGIPGSAPMSRSASSGVCGVTPDASGLHHGHSHEGIHDHDHGHSHSHDDTLLGQSHYPHDEHVIHH